MAKDEIEPEDLEEELEGEELDILEDELDDDVLLSDDDAIDDDDEDDMVAPDDVEEDLAAILDDRLKSEDLTAEEDEVVETDDRTGSDDALQPKRADEVQCSVCFLLVRPNAPTCPMSDDTCPVFINK